MNIKTAIEQLFKLLNDFLFLEHLNLVFDIIYNT